MHQNGYNGISEETVEIDIYGLLCGGWTLEDTTLKSCKFQTFKAVSYTHLTLPTKRIV